MLATVPSQFRLHGSSEVTVVPVTIAWLRIVLVPVAVRIVPVTVRIVVRIPIRVTDPKEEPVTKEAVVVMMEETVMVTMKETTVVTMKGEIM
jgi:hypothetical protein